MVERVSVLPLQCQQVLGVREQVEISDETSSIQFPDLSKLLQRIVHVLRHFGAKVDVRRAHDFGERVSQSDLLDGDVEVEVHSVLESHLRVVQHLEFLVVWSGSLVCSVELVHTTGPTPESLNNEHPELSIHDLKPTEVVECAIGSLFFGQLFRVQVTAVLQIETGEVDSLKRCLDVLHSLGTLVRHDNDHALEYGTVDVCDWLWESGVNGRAVCDFGDVVGGLNRVECFGDGTLRI